MQIRSNFKDYYDFVQGLSPPDDLVYRRYPETTQPKGWSETRPHLEFVVSSSWRHFPSSYSGYIGFCGTFHPFLHLVPYYLKDWADRSRFCYSTADVDALIRGSEADKRMVEEYFEGRDDKAAKRRPDTSLDSFFVTTRNLRRQVRQFFGEVDRLGPKTTWEDNVLGKMEKHGVPIVAVDYQAHEGFLRRGAFLTTNPRLADYGFEPVRPPHQAFQELQMWLGNRAEPRKPIPEIDDTTMADIKGFDRWSFRQPPDPKTAKRRKHRA